MNFATTRVYEAALRTAAALGPERTLSTRMHARAESFLGGANIPWERNFLFVRPAIAVLVAVASFLPGSRMPGRDGVLVACGAAVLLNLVMVPIVVRRRMYLMRVISLLGDNGVVIGGSLYVFMKMGQVGYESDLWMLYVCLIVTNTLYYGPIGSALFSLLWTSLFVFESTWFYPRGSYTSDHLAMRLVFFALTSLVSFSLAAELRKRSERLEHKTRQTLSMLATIVEARDTDAGLHLQHIQRYSLALALRLGLEEAAAREVAYAAMIHDVGKAQVPDAILKKPGPLTIEERTEIEKHTLWADALLAESDEFAAARQVARWHHEHFDGTGYPDGLAEEDIPLAARIVAVADVYDALVSERPYKRAWPDQEAIAEIIRLRGTHLDPEVVNAFVHLYNTNVLRDLDDQMCEDGSADVGDLAA